MDMDAFDIILDSNKLFDIILTKVDKCSKKFYKRTKRFVFFMDEKLS